MRERLVSERSPLRLPAAAAALVAAAAHVPVTGAHLREAPYIGVLFIALEITLVALALALVVADTRPVWAACGIVPALAIGAYVLSRLVPLPQMADDVGNWAEPLGVVSVGFEALLVLCAAAQLLDVHAVRWIGRRPLAAALVVLVVGVSLTVRFAAVTSGAHTDHLGAGRTVHPR
jgi:hypothetical protein